MKYLRAKVVDDSEPGRRFYVEFSNIDGGHCGRTGDLSGPYAVDLASTINQRSELAELLRPYLEGALSEEGKAPEGQVAKIVEHMIIRASMELNGAMAELTDERFPSRHLTAVLWQAFIRELSRRERALHQELHLPPGQCPDGGFCHHSCGASACWRVGWSGPLSGVFPDDAWPAEIVAEHSGKSEGHL